MEQIYDSRHSGQDVDDAVDAVRTTIPSQLTQIGSNLDELETTLNGGNIPLSVTWTDGFIYSGGESTNTAYQRTEINLLKGQTITFKGGKGSTLDVYALAKKVDTTYTKIQSYAQNAVQETIVYTAPEDMTIVISSGKTFTDGVVSEVVVGEIKEAENRLESKLGDLENLQTSAKTSAVEAINEVNSEVRGLNKKVTNLTSVPIAFSESDTFISEFYVNEGDVIIVDITAISGSFSLFVKGFSSDYVIINSLGKKEITALHNGYLEFWKRSSAGTIEGSLALKSYLSEQFYSLGSKLGDLTELETEEKTNLVDAINEVKEGMGAEVGTFTDGRTTTVCQSIEDLESQEPAGGGLSSAAIALLSSILNAGLYGSDQNDNIASLIEELSSGGGGSSVAAPTITVSNYVVSISAETEGSIYYTTDGSRPSSSSTLYTEPFTPENDCTIKAVVYNGNSKSAIASFEYTAYVIDYIVFQDPAVETAALAAFDINGDGVIKLEEARNVTSLSAMTFPSTGEYFNELKYFTSVTAIPNKFFMKSTSGSNVLKEVTLPQSIRSIGTNAAYQQFGITKFLLNEGLQIVGNSAFINCYNVVQSGAMPSTITTIGSSAFEKNKKAAWDTLPPGIVSIGNKAFNDTAVSFDSIPSTLTTIGDSAFETSSVAFSSIPDTVTSIGSAAFRGTKVTFTEMPAAMEDVHFKGCTGITVFTVREGITAILGSAFMNCSNLTSVTLPSTITSIGQWAFANCSKLTSLTITATTPPTLYDGSVLPNVLRHIYVPAESVDAYKAAEYWSSFANYIYAIE